LASGGVEGELEALTPVLEATEVVELQSHVRQVRVAEPLLRYLLELVQRTRRHPSLALGVSTRGALSLQRAAQALALLSGRDYVIPDDLVRVAVPVMAHRVILAGANGQAASQSDAERAVIQEIVATTPVPW
jgi:MoxR-like ATPase